MFLLADSASAPEVIDGAEKVIDDISNDASKFKEYLDKFVDGAITFGVKLILVFIIFIIGRFIIKKLLKIVDKIMDKSSIDIGVKKFIGSFLNIILYVVLIIILCDKLGIDTTSFAAILASGGLAVGLAFEGSLSNFAGGVLILIMKPFKVGDYIEANGVQGVVDKIDIFYTSLTTVDNKAIKMPNGALSNSTLINYSMNDKRRVDITIGIHYDDDIAKAQKALTDLMFNYDKILRDCANAVVVAGYGDSSVNLQIRMWVATEDYWDGTFFLNERISSTLADAGVTIPYNQMDIRIVNQG